MTTATTSFPHPPTIQVSVKHKLYPPPAKDQQTSKKAEEEKPNPKHMQCTELLLPVSFPLLLLLWRRFYFTCGWQGNFHLRGGGGAI